MRNAIRCCIACIFPCGSLDVIRIVHSNGKVEEISDSHVKASEIMKLYPKHILKKSTSSYSSSSNDQNSCSPKIVVVPPDAELQRGKIYFLMPMPSSSSSVPRDQKSKTRSKSSTKNKKKIRHVTSEGHENGDSTNLLTSDQKSKNLLTSDQKSKTHCRSSTKNKKKIRHVTSEGHENGDTGNLLTSYQYLSDILSEKVSTQRDRRRGRVGVWRPHLESISETIIES